MLAMDILANDPATNPINKSRPNFRATPAMGSLGAAIRGEKSHVHVR